MRLLSKFLCASVCILAAIVCEASEIAYTESAEQLELSNGLTKLVLAKPALTLVQITDLQRHEDWVTEPGAGLFSVTGMIPNQKPPAWYVVAPGIPVGQQAFPTRKASTITTADGRQGWKLEFSGAKLGDGELSAEITITLAKDSPLLEWRIAVANTSTTPLQDLHFPILGGLGAQVPNAESTEYLAAPIYSGQILKGLRKNSLCGPGLTEYPGSGMSLQLFTYCDGQGGAFYFATHDPLLWRKSYAQSPSASQHAFTQTVWHYADAPYAPGVWRLPYPVACGPIAGDWYDAAKLYRSWAITQPVWKRSLAERTELPAWFRALPVWFQGQSWDDGKDQMMALADRLAHLRELLGFDFGFHWYIWQKYLVHDYYYPDYLPERPGFPEAIARVHQAGIKVMPYLNIHLAEIKLPQWKQLHWDLAAKRNSTGDLYFQYGCGHTQRGARDTSQPVDLFRSDADTRTEMVPMCIGEPSWRNYLMGVAKHLIDVDKVDMIYWDETYVFPGICYAANHQHRWLGGPDHARAVAEFHRESRALTPEGVVTAGENLGECYIDVCTLMINGHSDYDPASIPLFPTVFSDRVVTSGCFLYRSELPRMEVFASKLAFGLCRGRQLGWFNTDQGVLDLDTPRLAPQLNLLKQYCAVRTSALDWLFDGEMLRAPDFSALPKVSIPWVIWPDPNKVVSTDFPVVTGAMYRAPNGRLGLVLCNLTDQPQTVDIPWNTRDWGPHDAPAVHATLAPWQPLLLKL